MRIVVIDGQGGGLGASLVSRLKARLGSSVQVWVVGTNAMATSAMLKAGADKGATGENAACWNAGRADLIMGPIGLLAANSLMGEISPAIAAAVSAAKARRILVPVSSCGLLIAGTEHCRLEDALTSAVDLAAGEVAGR